MKAKGNDGKRPFIIYSGRLRECNIIKQYPLSTLLQVNVKGKISDITAENSLIHWLTEEEINAIDFSESEEGEAD